MTKIVVAGVIFLFGCIACGQPARKKGETRVIGQSDWSQPSNGLSAKIVATYEYSPEHAQVIHPKVLLRNVSPQPIRFLKCMRFAGTFVVKTPKGKTVERDANLVRSGPVGVEVVLIDSGQTIELDAYDYTLGLKTDPSVYIFYTDSTQVTLHPGEYVMDYSLAFDRPKIESILASFHRAERDPGSIWAGTISVDGTRVLLE